MLKVPVAMQARRNLRDTTLGMGRMSVSMIAVFKSKAIQKVMYALIELALLTEGEETKK